MGEQEHYFHFLGLLREIRDIVYRKIYIYRGNPFYDSYYILPFPSE